MTLLIYYEMFSAKLMDLSAKDDYQQLNIEAFFKNHTILESQTHRNPFNGFLIDFEFLYLKKNYSLKIKENCTSPKTSILSGLLGPAKTKVKTKDMKGMVSSTIFTLDQSSTSSTKTRDRARTRALSVMRVAQETPLEESEKSPFLLDYIVRHSKG